MVACPAAVQGALSAAGSGRCGAAARSHGTDCALDAGAPGRRTCAGAWRSRPATAEVVPGARVSRPRTGSSTWSASACPRGACCAFHPASHPWHPSAPTHTHFAFLEGADWLRSLYLDGCMQRRPWLGRSLLASGKGVPKTRTTPQRVTKMRVSTMCLCDCSAKKSRLSYQYQLIVQQ